MFRSYGEILILIGGGKGRNSLGPVILNFATDKNWPFDIQVALVLLVSFHKNN